MIKLPHSTSVRARRIAHLDLGKDGHADVYWCLDTPRLSFMDKQLVVQGFKRVFSVDGEVCHDFADALERLEVPVELTDEERGWFDSLPSAWTDLIQWEKRTFSSTGRATQALIQLRNKGLIELKSNLKSPSHPWIRRRADAAP